MTPVLIGKDLVLEGSTTKIEDKQVPGIYIYIIYTPDRKNELTKIRNFPTPIEGFWLRSLGPCSNNFSSSGFHFVKFSSK